MAETVLGLICVFLAVLCGSLYQQNAYEKKKSERIIGELVTIKAALASVIALKAVPPLTAGEIVERKKAKAAFMTHRSWAEEQAELERQHDPARVRHENVVQEIEKEHI